MGAAVCKRRRDDGDVKPASSAPSVLSSDGRKFCVNEACADVDCSSTTTACTRSTGSWIFAVEHRDLDALEGADLSEVDGGNGNSTALLSCINAGWVAGVQNVLRRRVDPSATDDQGHSPLHAAAKLGRCDLQQLLIEAGADLDLQDRDMENDEEFRGGHFEKKTANRTALHYAAEALSRDACDLLLSRGARVGERDCWYKTPLHLAEEELASEEQVSVVELLLRHGADPNLGNMERGPNQTSLLTAIYEKNIPLVELFVKRGADLKVGGKQGMTALHLAARMRSERLVTILLDGRADPSQRTPSGSTAADLARSNGSTSLAALIEGTKEAAGGSTLMDELS